MTLPLLGEHGDLPPGVYRTTLQEVIERFGKDSVKRRVLALRLERIYRLAQRTGCLARFVVFGSFITAKTEPNDVDVFMIMEDIFDVGQLMGESRILFNHEAAQNHFGCSVFWVRRLAALGGEQTAIEYWQIKRDGGQRGIVEIVLEVP